ncbi:hypothetical protein GQ54DRAFT_306213 [Martensiomyces pterosporus]|nr:hypothetical protein GQ54DRAFT_306213 [Martensiomyces pterosporus]
MDKQTSAEEGGRGLAANSRMKNSPFMHRVRHPILHGANNGSTSSDVDKGSEQPRYVFKGLQTSRSKAARELIIADVTRTQPPSPTIPNGIFSETLQSAHHLQQQPATAHALPPFRFEFGSSLESSFELSVAATSQWDQLSPPPPPVPEKPKFTHSNSTNSTARYFPASPKESISSSSNSSEDPQMMSSLHQVYPASAARADHGRLHEMQQTTLFPKRNYSLPTTPAPLAVFELKKYEFASIEQLERKWGEVRTEATKILRSAIYKYYFSHGAWSDFAMVFPEKIVAIWEEFQSKLPASELAYLNVPLISQNPFAPEGYEHPYTPVIARAIPLPQVVRAIVSSGDMRSRKRVSGGDDDQASPADQEFADWLLTRFNAAKAAPQTMAAEESPPPSASTRSGGYEREQSWADSVSLDRVIEDPVLVQRSSEQSLNYEGLCSALSANVTPRNSSQSVDVSSSEQQQPPVEEEEEALPDLNLPALPPKKAGEKKKVPLKLRNSYKKARRRTQNFFSSNPTSAGWQAHQKQPAPPLPINHFTMQAKALPPIPSSAQSPPPSNSYDARASDYDSSDNVPLASLAENLPAPQQDSQQWPSAASSYGGPEDSLNLAPDLTHRPVSPASIARGDLGITKPYAHSSASLLARPEQRLGSSASTVGQSVVNLGITPAIRERLGVLPERPRSSTLTINAGKNLQLTAPTIAVPSFLDLDSPQERDFKGQGGLKGKEFKYDWRYVPPDTGTAWGFQISPMVYHQPLPRLQSMMSSLVIQANIPTLNHRNQPKEAEASKPQPVPQSQPAPSSPVQRGAVQTDQVQKSAKQHQQQQQQQQHQGAAAASSGSESSAPPDVHLILREVASVSTEKKESWGQFEGVIVRMRMAGLEISRIAEQDFYDFCVDELLKASVDAFNDVSMMGNECMATEIFNSFNYQLNHLLANTNF